MPEIILENITKKFGNTTAVDNVNMTIKDKSFISLLGPSGCGKTTLLRMITGFETPTTGNIYIDGKVVFSKEKGISVPPSMRGVGFLFQNYALWPHMTVSENICFGLKNAKKSKEFIQNKLNNLSEMLHITEYLKRYPAELSGGQQQRVAIARTLSTDPGILFMDEPLSNLDAKLRNEMRVELKRLHQESDSTFVYVTHDQLEAMTLSTKICLLKKGKIQQYGSPIDIYNNSANLFVADFVGNPATNIIQGQIKKNKDYFDLSMFNTKFKFIPKENEANIPEGEIFIGIRPEFIQLNPQGEVKGQIYSTLPSGMETIIKIKIGEEMITSVKFGNADYKYDQHINLAITKENVVIFDKATENKIASGILTD